MGKRRREHSDAFKAKVALEAIKGVRTLSELSSAYGVHYEPIRTESEENLRLMRRIDELYLKRPFYGSPRMTWWLGKIGWHVNEKRVARLMRLMGLQAVLPGPHTSRPHPQHRIYPYLLRDLTIRAPDEAWSADITYLPMRRGFMAISDSRKAKMFI